MLPILFIASIGMAILYNLGTNIFAGEISYITMALAAVLQLGVTMDYSIFLWHSFSENLQYYDTKEEAMGTCHCGHLLLGAGQLHDHGGQASLP